MSWSTYWCVPHPATRPRLRRGGRDLRLRLLQPGRGRPAPPPGLIGKDVMEGFLVALVVSFGVIFVAELGDKSQLMALTFATRFKTGPGAHRHHRRHRGRAPGLGGHRRRAGCRAAHRAGSPSSPAWRSSASARGRCAATSSPRRRSARPRGPASPRSSPSVGRVLPRRAGRQDDARHHHPGHQVRLVRHLARLDHRHGRRRRAGHPRRPDARPAAAGARPSSTARRCSSPSAVSG